MLRSLTRVFDIRPGERRLTALMALSYFLLLSTFYFLKSARDSLFLFKLTPEQLPLVFIVSALASIPIAGFYIRASRRLSLLNLIVGTSFVLIACLVLLRYLLAVGSSWVFYAFYAWVGVYGILVTALFWLLANAVFDVQQAKRLFTFLGAAGILGAFCAGEATSLLVNRVHLATENLIILAAAILVLATLVIAQLAKLHHESTRERESSARPEDGSTLPTIEVLQTVRKSRLLQTIVALIAVAVMTSTIIDFVFKEICFNAYGGSKQELTAFFGVFYGRVSLLALVIQLLLTYPLVRRLGVGGVIVIMPLTLIGTSLGVIVAPLLLPALALKGSEGLLEYSADRSGRELLFMPLSLDLKKRVKVFVDVFVDRLFRGVAGVVLLVATGVFAFGARQMAVIAAVLALVWLLIALVVRREYVETFRLAIEHRDIDISDLRTAIDDSQTLKMLTGYLSSPHERQVTYALDLLKSARDPSLVESISSLLRHASPEVRRRAVEVLQEYHELVK